ncbi:MAG: glycoside hydrolase family 13 protein [Dactylosporangium sp.]|nr:glycoside hydrolase family 13 protein [Dactylosporangium sp.]
MESGDIAPVPTAAWWQAAVIYQVYPQSFADSNADGIGDLPGITSRLGHLATLGVDAVWLSPFYRSPMRDGGYDVADYRDVDPMFGTLADFDALLAEAHRLGLRVIVDIVPNHTSSEHRWFVEALAAPSGSAARDRYIFRQGSGPDGDEPPNDWQSVFGGLAWTRVADGEWYLHLFDSSQPDLDWLNREVHAEFESTLRFWLDRGVDGFRVDVAHGLIKADGLPDVGHTNQGGIIGRDPLPYFDQDGVHEIYREWRKIIDSYPGERIAVAEAWTSTVERAARYVAPDELHQAFNFEYLFTPWSATDLRASIDGSIAACGAIGAPPTWVLSNHDVQRHTTRYGALGAAGLRRARAATLLTMALPGSCYLYQGEELGLPEVTDLPPDARRDPQWFRTNGAEPGRDGCRVPMPWSGTTPPFDFSPGESAAPWLPVPASWASMTAERQAANPGSTLSLYRTALRIRKEHPALGYGPPLRWLDTPTGVLAFVREPERDTAAGGAPLTCVVNLTEAPVSLRDVLERADLGPPLLASDRLSGDQLPPDTAAWW